MREKIILIITIVIFILGFYVCLNYREGFESGRKNKEDGEERQCPDILIQEGSKIILKNSKLAEIPGVNPIVFNNLEGYVEYLRWQKSQNIRCPVLYLQKSYNAQGEASYKIRPDILEPQGGLPPYLPELEQAPDGKEYEASLLVDSGRNDQPYNTNSYPAYDPDNQYIGLEVPIDRISNERPEGGSNSAMDDDWVGLKQTEQDIKDGRFKDREVIKRT